jgi:hypothetical protein
MVNRIGWIGTGSSILGAFSVAMHYLVMGYSLFLLGSISWLLVAIYRRERSLAVLNGFFLAANLIGLYNGIC